MRRLPEPASSTSRSDVQRRPILANSCARAASATEARYRIATPIADERSTAVLALDSRARAIVDASRSGHSARARFVAYAGGTLVERPLPCGVPPQGNGGDGGTGAPGRPLDHALADTDLVVMVATSVAAGPAAATVGDWCADRGIMTAGLVVGPRDETEGTATALRPHARMLLLTEDVGDLDDILTAIRA